MNVRSGLPLLVLAFAVAFVTAFDARAHSGNTIEGVYTYVIERPYQGATSRGQRVDMITADDGHRIKLDLTAASLPPEGVAGIRNRRIRVTAADTTARAEAMGISENFRARSVQVLNDIVGFSRLSAVTGNQKYISILCKFSDKPAVEPRTPAYFTTQLNNTYPGFNHFFREVSYNTLTLDGSQADVAWVTLPLTRVQYNALGAPVDYLGAMFDDCTAAANATVDFSQYFGINMMFNDKVDDTSAWGGSWFSTLDGVTRSWPVTWMPYWGDGVLFGWNDHGVLAHEMSHAFGSLHSKDPSGFEYGSAWDVVSNPGGTCLVTQAGVAGYGCIGQHPVAYNKIAMGIMPAARIVTHAAGANLTAYNVERMTQPPMAGGTFQVIKAAITGTTAQFYTIESRKRVGYDQNVPADGVILHKVTTGNPQPAHLLSPLGTASNLGDIDALWGVGSVFISVPDNIKITVNSFSVDGTANVTVQPATDPGTYTFALAGTTVIEGNTTAALIAVTRSAPFTTAGSVAWTTGNSTAVAGTDFGTTGAISPLGGTLTWIAGTGGVKNITVGLPSSNIPVINNVAPEPAKDFAINLSSPVGGVLGAQPSTTVTIADGSVVNFTANLWPVAETAGSVVLTVERTGSTALAQVVSWATSNGVALAGQDFGVLGSTLQRTGTLSFPAGSAATQNITVPILNDTTIEGPESFTVRLTSGTNGASIGAVNIASVTINSDDAGVTMGAASRPFTEGAGAQQIVVARSGSLGTAISVNYTVNNGTATRGTHFNSLANGTLNWGIGDGANKVIDVDILNDFGVNASRSFTVVLSGALGAAIGLPSSTSVSIADNDTSVQFTVPTIAVAEGVAGNVVTLTLARTGLITDPATVTYTSVNGTAVAGTDFGVLGNTAAVTNTVAWAAGVGGNKTLTIPILNDLLVEGAKNFRVLLSNPVGTNIGNNSEILVNLSDNDKGVAFSSATYQATELTNPTVTLTVQRIGPATTAATATWATVNGTATAGQDFGLVGSTAPRTGTVSWLAGDAAAKSFTIPILDDSIGGEGNETFTVVLTPGTGLVLGMPGTATVTIFDNDIPPESTVAFSLPKYLVTEDGGSAALTVNRTDLGASVLGSTVKFSTVAGTALATSDYTTVTLGTLTWAAGDFAPKTILIPIVNNAGSESPESFRVVLSAPNPGTGFGTPTEATVLILDDDELFPADGVMPAGFSTPGGVSAGWHVSNDPGAFEGAYSLKSDEIIHGETAGLQVDGTFNVAGTVSFRVKVSTELNFDVLRFYLNNVLQPQSWSGTAVPGWVISPSYPVGIGPFNLRWVYTKDGSGTLGMDAVHIDGLAMPAFTTP